MLYYNYMYRYIFVFCLYIRIQDTSHSNDDECQKQLGNFPQTLHQTSSDLIWIEWGFS